MTRDLARLASEDFDVIVIGGGVYALAAAVELAPRGLRVAILERGDFAGATSFNSLRTIHGGIRALQHGALGEMREFVRERRAFAIAAPHLVRPLPFVVPTYRHPVRNRPAMALFLALYDRLAADRNDGVDASRRLPPSRTVGRDEIIRLNPDIDPAGVTGGAIWHDYQLHSPERFAMALLRSADGAAAANYVAADALLIRRRTVVGVRARDMLSGALLEVRGRVVVNAAGPWAPELLARSGIGGLRPAFSLAMNVVVARPPLPHAVGGLAGGRYLFMVPGRDCSLLGTSHDPHHGPADLTGAVAERLQAFLRDLAAAFPRAAIRREEVRHVHRGLLPAVRTGASEALLKESIVHDHRREGVHGLVTVVGVRYTTARATARKTAEHVWPLLGRGALPSRDMRRPLSGGNIADLAEFERTEPARWNLPPDEVRRLISAYGTEYTAVARRMQEDPDLARPLAPGLSVTGAEIDYAVRHEMAVRLGDALLRRTGAGSTGHPGREAAERAAAIMGKALSWSAVRVEEEIAAIDAYYALT